VCLSVCQIEYAGGGWPKPIDKRMCVPTTCENSIFCRVWCCIFLIVLKINLRKFLRYFWQSFFLFLFCSHLFRLVTNHFVHAVVCCSCHKLLTNNYCLYGLLRGTMLERWSLAGELSLSCTRPAADA